MDAWPVVPVAFWSPCCFCWSPVLPWRIFPSAGSPGSPRSLDVWASKNPAREGWPEVGQQVTWVAHVRNLTGAVQTGIGYRWKIDGTTVAAGTVDLSVDGPVEVELPWSWTFTRHELVFEIDTTGRVQEAELAHNRLRFTDAPGVGIWWSGGLDGSARSRARSSGAIDSSMIG